MRVLRKKQTKKESLLSDKDQVMLRKRSERAVMLRETLGHSRAYFKDKYDLSPSTLQMWETFEKGGLGEDAAYRLSNIYQQEGLNVTPEWLMYGMGTDPLERFRIGSPGFGKIPTSSPSNDKNIGDELKYFHALNVGALHQMIEDDAFLPWLAPGDYVAGLPYYDSDIKNCIGHICIVELENGETLVRHIKAGSSDGCYTLVCTNPESMTSNRILHDCKLVLAAPIIRIWKEKPSQF